MTDYLLGHGSRATRQTEQADPTQIPNNAGGYVWAVDQWTRLRRFLILGSEGGSYYASEHDLTKENVKCIRECIDADGPRTVTEIVEVSQGGRAPKNDPALYALAACISHGDKATRSQAAEALPKVARTGTHLYHFVAYAETMRGWGRTMRWAVSNWYETKGDRLAYDAVKYRQRDGWSHRDLLRLAHPTMIPGRFDDVAGQTRAAIYDWITHGNLPAEEVIAAFVEAQAAETPEQTASLVTEFGLPREALKTEHLTAPVVWEAMLAAGMPMTAMIRNLANMTRAGILNATSQSTRTIVEQLHNEDAIRRSRVHPLTILLAQATYASGRGLRGGNTWNPTPQIVDALDDAFYLAFGNVEPTGKRILIALDVSSSMMGWGVAGTPLSPAQCAAAMALVTAKTETTYEVMGFAHEFRSIPISPKMRLDDVIKAAYGAGFGGTDCSLPMQWALRERKDFDAFLVYTDNETWYGQVHPFQALRDYRAQRVADARLAVIGMVANNFTIANSLDAGMMDVVGFDTAAPGLIQEFVAGGI